jgi:hypothetical protein
VASKKSDSDSEKDGEGGGPAEETHGPQECMPCRGVGKVISNLGDEASTVTCPWCQGSGTRTPGVDAQQAWLDERGEASDAEAAAEQAA